MTIETWEYRSVESLPGGTTLPDRWEPFTMAFDSHGRLWWGLRRRVGVVESQPKTARIDPERNALRGMTLEEIEAKKREIRETWARHGAPIQGLDGP